MAQALADKSPEQAPAPSGALQNYDLLPDSAHVRLPVVTALYGCSPASVWRMVKRKAIPAPRKLSARVTAWHVGELRRALAVHDAA